MPALLVISIAAFGALLWATIAIARHVRRARRLHRRMRDSAEHLHGPGYLEELEAEEAAGAGDLHGNGAWIEKEAEADSGPREATGPGSGRAQSPGSGRVDAFVGKSHKLRNTARRGRSGAVRRGPAPPPPAPPPPAPARSSAAAGDIGAGFGTKAPPAADAAAGRSSDLRSGTVAEPGEEN